MTTPEAPRLRVIQVRADQLRTTDVSGIAAAFQAASRIPKNAKVLRGNVIFTFPDYDQDPREVTEVPEVRRFIRALDAQIPYFLYYVVPHYPLGQVGLWIMCVLDIATELQPVDLDVMAEVYFQRMFAVATFCDTILDASQPIVSAIWNWVPPAAKSKTRKLLEDQLPGQFQLTS